MKTTHRKKIIDLDPLEPTLDDLRMFIRQIKLHVQLGDEQIIGEARQALLAVLGGSAERLLKKHKIVSR
jgi:hypothetical protein